MSSQPNQPPPPNNPPPGRVFTDEELEAMPPLRCNNLTPAVVENIVGKSPVNMAHYDIALTHPSAGAEFDYEQYEFLGDAVLNFVTAKFLFEHHAERGEGFMTVMRSKLTRCEHLAKLANALGLPHFVKMDATSIFTKQNFSKKVEEDLFEAFVAAVYLDLGLLAAKKFILDVYEKHVDWNDLSKNRNYKELLMQRQHAVHDDLPAYSSIRDEATLIFTTTASIPGASATGTARNKKKSEQGAARALLVQLGVEID
jgi:ribonuclease III